MNQAVVRSPQLSLQTRTDKRAKPNSTADELAVDARIESAINDDTATAAETIHCVAFTSDPANAINGTHPLPGRKSTLKSRVPLKIPKSSFLQVPDFF